MSSEFTKIGSDTARSDKGFAVVFHSIGWVDFADIGGVTLRVDSEQYVDPLRHMLYARSKGLRHLNGARAAAILADIQRALDYLGHPTEISRN